MKALLSLFIITFSIKAYCWSITDKLLYDNYKGCVNHKLADIDKRKINITIARQAIEQDCKKAFCSNKISVTNEEYDACVQRNVEYCEARNLYRKIFYKNHEKNQEDISQVRKQCLAELVAKHPSWDTYIDQYVCSRNTITVIDYYGKPYYEVCEESKYYDSCKEGKFVDDTCR